MDQIKDNSTVKPPSREHGKCDDAHCLASWWMTWLMRSVDHTGGECPKPKGSIGLIELKAIFRIGLAREWRSPLMTRGDLLAANNELSDRQDAGSDQ